MTLIPFPNVPNYPGVPPIPRRTIGSSAININLATTDGSSIGNNQQEPVWGIFSVTDNSAIYTPSEGGTLSTYSFDYSRQTTVSTFPVEDGSFANYDKVWSPANPVVTLAFSGSESEKTALLSVLEAACLYPTLWNVCTPDAEYENYTIERYTYRRMATKGATMLLIDISLKEIKPVTVSYTSASPTTPDAQSPSAATPESSGQVQPSTPSSGTIQKAYTWIKRALGITPPSD